jgi:hypothetical protein
MAADSATEELVFAFEAFELVSANELARDEASLKSDTFHK